MTKLILSIFFAWFFSLEGMSEAFPLGAIWFSYILVDLTLHLEDFCFIWMVDGRWGHIFCLFKPLHNNIEVNEDSPN